MADQFEEQLSLFPTADSVEEVIAEASAQLPITNHNQVVALVRLLENTIANIYARRQWRCGGIDG